MSDVALPGLVERVSRGDASAFAQLYTLTCDEVRSLLVAAGDARSPTDIDDQLVAAYVRVWRQASTYAPSADAWSWIVATVRPVARPDQARVRPTLRTAARPTRRAASDTSTSP